MTDTTDLAAWLRVQLDWHQQAAQEANAVDPAPWTAISDRDESTNIRNSHGSGIVKAADDEPLWDCEGSGALCMTAPTAEHVIRNDPDRVLRGIAAKRALADGLARVAGGDYIDDGEPVLAEWALQQMAAEYADRPGYREEWRP